MHPHDSPPDHNAFGTIANIEYGKRSSLDSMADPRTVRATRERDA
jgi:hypothetical protein